MKVTDVVPKVSNQILNKELKPSSGKAKEALKESESKKDSFDKVQWQNEILLSALDMLENSKQIDNSHPLTRADYRPIETFDEAMTELNQTRNGTFAREASGAQANLKSDDVMSLFTEN